MTATALNQTTAFCEDTRVEIPAIIQFMRLGYEYQSLRDADFDPKTKIEIGRFQAAVNRLNGSMYVSNFCQTVEKLGYRVALVPEDEACDYIIVDE